MNAEQITNVLVAHLTCANPNLRIYKERVIGSNICDVMAVSDSGLVGYEVKSDVDDYSRLQNQIKAYNLHFDKNYVVVGEKHCKSAHARIPADWGIVVIRQDGVEVVREAKLNKAVSRRSQLTLLWKIELKNLLVKNNLPLYALRDKNFIADRLIGAVDKATLGRQIAQELYSRDYDSVGADEDDNATTICGMSQSALTDALSEEDLSELTLDKWIDLYRKAKAIGAKKQSIEVDMQNLRPHDVPYTDIEVSLGAPWKSVEIVNDFVFELLDLTHARAAQWYPDLIEQKKLVAYEPITGNWIVYHKHAFGDTTLGQQKWGTKKYNALYIIEATLNLREIKLYNHNNKFDEAATIAALEKQRLITEEFKRWIWQDDKRRWEVEDAYNLMFSNLSAPQFDGSKLNFQDQNPQVELFDYQKNAVMQIVSTPNTLLAFDVGAGKTYIMIAAAMTMRNNGLSRKNMFVVPNNIVGQWEEMFLRLYPRARVLAVDPKNFRPPLRHKILAQMRDGDYDGIIVAYSCFEQIKLSQNFIKAEIDKLINKLHAAKAQQTDYSLQTFLKRETSGIQTELKHLLKKLNTTADEITFDTLGINTLFLDEAHNYKNLPLNTRLDNVRGVNVKGSSKCSQMLYKVRCVQRQNNGRGAVFATGTPLCNSISDAYVMQLYLQNDVLQRNHLHTFDNWVKTFAKPEQSFEIDVNVSSFRMVRRFVKFHNLPELSKMFTSFSAFYSAEKSGLPTLDGYANTVIQQSEAQKDYMRKICERTEKIRNNQVHPSQDNMLKVTTDGRAAALDLTLVGEKQVYDDTSKIVHCVNNVWQLYNKYEGCSQLIFCDNSTPKGKDFSVYAEIKRQLCALGIPDKEIAFVHSYHSEVTRLKLYEDVNCGKVRVLIGSTFKLGIGANVQTKLKAVHHLDVPWRPADMVQREGRILRRGNQNSQVFIYRYIIEGSFDAYSWQILETKQRFITQFLSGKVQNRAISDLEDSVLSYAEVKALALSEPQMKLLAEKENQLRNLRILRMKEAENRDLLSSRAQTLQLEVENLANTLTLSIENLNYVQNQLNIDKDLLAETLERIKPLELYLPQTELGRVGQFVLQSPAVQSNKKPFVELLRLGVCYKMEFGDSVAGNARRIVNFFGKFPQTVAKQQQEVDNKRKEIVEIHQQLTLPLVYDQQVAQCQKQVDDLINTLRDQLEDNE